jgi:hypothetical protein
VERELNINVQRWEMRWERWEMLRLDATVGLSGREE